MSQDTRRRLASETCWTNIVNHRIGWRARKNKNVFLSSPTKKSRDIYRKVLGLVAETTCAKDQPFFTRWTSHNDNWLNKGCFTYYCRLFQQKVKIIVFDLSSSFKTVVVCTKRHNMLGLFFIDCLGLGKKGQERFFSGCILLFLVFFMKASCFINIPYLSSCTKIDIIFESSNV